MQYSLSEATTVPEEVVAKWQHMVDLLCRIAGVPVALIMRVANPNIEVFVSSRTEGNPYHVGENEYLPNSGLYCETVIKTRAKLMVPNALEDLKWKYNPDIKKGLISYLGFPIMKPNGHIFGTLCVLDNKENSFYPDIEELMLEFKELLESHLALIFNNAELREALTRVSKLSLQLERAAGTDPLTGLMNRRTFDKLIPSIQAKERLSRQTMSFILLDLDRFKDVNDTLGHQAGDEALCHVASVIKRRCRRGDLIWRWGGEEFLIVLPGTPVTGGVKFAEELRSAFEREPFVHMGVKHHITLSAGVSELVEDEGPDNCLVRCDRLMYEAKQAGRNQIRS
ncbi:sensor domain-containing diguanylate cyclase [bacterium]|nr:sensor domain-containing diguanylate cyclase [bacterium]